VDVDDDWIAAAKRVVDSYPRFLDEFETLLTGNEILMARTQRVGILPRELAIAGSITGPMLRASGVDYDIRKVDRYGIYNRFDFRVPLGEVGDVYDRFYVRLLEMRESLKILRKALQDIPSGPFVADVKMRNFKVPAGSVYSRIESPKGELGFYLVSEGGPSPYRYHVRAPSFINLTILEDMCLGQKVADAVVILGSVDIVLGEVDR
jgi:NADH-quinone oxidoreductase subunit D